MKTKFEKSISSASRGGFTLVELLLVIAILGVLATVAVQNLAGTSEESRITAARTSIEVISSAAKTYEIRVGKYPDSFDKLFQSIGDRPPLLEEKSKTDPWGNVYSLRRDGYKIEIRSAGPDGQMNTADDITN